MNELDLFVAALAITDTAQRAIYLERECQGNIVLQERIKQLLAASAAAESFLEPSQDAPAATADLPAADVQTATFAAEDADKEGIPTVDLPGRGEHVGAIVGGKYKLIEEIGEGGMGSVFMAQQTEPVKRAVAVKVIKAGMDSKAVLTRFEAERQALAMMDHPNIAKVLDAGTTEGGRPFFVMELVKGVPITQYCDEQKLTPKQRLELFVPICQAIQHAHQKGIIHRDIKPSNVLVALYDDRPVPKVIDFGVAKATGPTLTDKTLMTGFGAVVGTPEYMSPEQANLNNLDIDTRSDVYSLGVLLYELLTGVTPVDRKSLGKAALLEVLRIVREVEAPKPSHKLSTSDALPSIAANRGTEPRKLTELLRSELDWLVLKALEKDRTRRYDTANGLARDIQRYLADEVVEARPPSSGYRLRKFVKRHKGQVIAASLVVLALVVGVIGTSLGLLEAQRLAAIAFAERDAKETARAEEAIQREAAVKAEHAERLAKLDAQKAAEAEKAALEQTKRRLAQIEKGVDLLASLLKGINPRNEENGGLAIFEQLRERANKAVEQLDAESVGDPQAVARLQTHLGDTLREMGELSQAIVVLKKACATLEREVGSEHPDTLESKDNLAVAYAEAGKWNLASPLYEHILKAREIKLGIDHFDTLTSRNNLALAYHRLGKLELAISLFERTVKSSVVVKGNDHLDTLVARHNLASAYIDDGKLDAAIEMQERVVKVSVAKLGANHVKTLLISSGLVKVYSEAGKYAMAIELGEYTLKALAAKLGATHTAALDSRFKLAQAYQVAGKLDLAVPLFEETLNLTKAKLGPEHPDTLQSMASLGKAYQDAGKLGLAIPLFEETLKLRNANLGPEHPYTIASMNDLASAYLDARKMELALPLFEETLKLRKANLGQEHRHTLITMNNLARAYQLAGKLDLALPLFEVTLKLQRATLGPEHPDTIVSMHNLAESYLVARKLELALPLLADTIQVSKKRFGPEHPKTLVIMNSLAGAYRSAGKLDLALTLHDDTLKLRKATLGLEHRDTVASMNNLALVYRDAKKLNLAIPLFVEAIELATKIFGPEHTNTLSSMINLANAYMTAGKFDLAIPLFERILKSREGKLGDNHLDTLYARNKLASAYLAAEKLDLAIPIFNRTLKALEDKLGTDHHHTLITRNGLASAFQASGMLELAIPLYEQTAQGIEKLRFQHEEAWNIITNTITAYEAAGRLEEAEAWRRKWLVHIRQQAGTVSPNYGGELAALALNQLLQKKWVEAESILRECLDIREKIQARLLVDIQHEVVTRRGTPGSEKVRRRRTAVVGRLRGYETA